MSENWIVGQAVRASVVITDHLAANADPGTVKLVVKDGEGNSTTYTYGVSTVERDSVGHYHAEIELTCAGRWFFRWETTTPYAGADEENIYVTPSRAS